MLGSLPAEIKSKLFASTESLNTFKDTGRIEEPTLPSSL